MVFDELVKKFELKVRARGWIILINQRGGVCGFLICVSFVLQEPSWSIRSMFCLYLICGSGIDLRVSDLWVWYRLQSFSPIMWFPSASFHLPSVWNLWIIKMKTPTIPKKKMESLKHRTLTGMSINFLIILGMTTKAEVPNALLTLMNLLGDQNAYTMQLNTVRRQCNRYTDRTRSYTRRQPHTHHMRMAKWKMG